MISALFTVHISPFNYCANVYVLLRMHVPLHVCAQVVLARKQ